MSSSDMPRAKPGVMDIAAYVPGRETAEGVAKVYKLSSNESPLGPSPKVAEAIAAQSANLAIYPDGSAHVLRDAISRAYGLNPANIMCGNGSDELSGPSWCFWPIQTIRPAPIFRSVKSGGCMLACRVM